MAASVVAIRPHAEQLFSALTGAVRGGGSQSASSNALAESFRDGALMVDSPQSGGVRPRETRSRDSTPGSNASRSQTKNRRKGDESAMSHSQTPPTPGGRRSRKPFQQLHCCFPLDRGGFCTN
jgi:hypothetical protein